MTAMTIVAARDYSDALLLGNSTNIDGDQALAFEVPSNFGDCLILNVRVQVAGIATMMTAEEDHGPAVIVVHTTPLDFGDNVGTARWNEYAAGTGLMAIIEPIRSVLWRTGESIYVLFSEVDTNATPTADVNVVVRVRRLRAP